MNQQLYKAMMDARRDLIDARTTLALVRKLKHSRGPEEHAYITRGAVNNFLRALDRAWDVQCMVVPSR